MARRPEKRDNLRLDLTTDTAVVGNGPFLNTPDLDKACEMALPTPILNRHIIDMYKPETVPKPTQQANEGPVTVSTQPPPQVPAVPVPTAQPTILRAPYPSQPIIFVSVPTSTVDPNIRQISHQPVGSKIGANSSLSHQIPVVPIDPSEQEKLKIDRKRERNRAAAQRCREKKIRRIDDLSNEVKQLEAQREAIMESLRSIEQKATQTLIEVGEHQHAGCEMDNAHIQKLVAKAERLKEDIHGQLSSISIANAVPIVYDDASTSGQG